VGAEIKGEMLKGSSMRTAGSEEKKKKIKWEKHRKKGGENPKFEERGRGPSASIGSGPSTKKKKRTSRGWRVL